MKIDISSIGEFLILVSDWMVKNGHSAEDIKLVQKEMFELAKTGKLNMAKQGFVTDLLKYPTIKSIINRKTESKKSIKTVLKEHIRKILLKESNTILIRPSFSEAVQKYLERNSIRYKNGRPISDRVAFEIEKRKDFNALVKLFKKSGVDFTLAESILKENNEEEQIAIDLIDYMGKQLPRMNWKMDKRIVGFFQELGMNVNDPQVAKIYQTALRLNR